MISLGDQGAPGRAGSRKGDTSTMTRKSTKVGAAAASLLAFAFTTAWAGQAGATTEPPETVACGLDRWLGGRQGAGATSSSA